MNYFEELKRVFESIIGDYQMQLIYISETEMALAKGDYMICFLMHAGELEILYLYRNKINEICKCIITSYLAYSYDDVDRKNVNNNEEDLIKEINIIASGIKRHWTNILEGDKNWLENYKSFFLALPIRKVSQKELEVYQKFI